MELLLCSSVLRYLLITGAITPLLHCRTITFTRILVSGSASGEPAIRQEILNALAGRRCYLRPTVTGHKPLTQCTSQTSQGSWLSFMWFHKAGITASTYPHIPHFSRLASTTVVTMKLFPISTVRISSFSPCVFIECCLCLGFLIQIMGLLILALIAVIELLWWSNERIDVKFLTQLKRFAWMPSVMMIIVI